MNENDSFPHFPENRNTNHTAKTDNRPDNDIYLKETCNNIPDEEPRDMLYLPPSVLTRNVAAKTRTVITNSVITLVSKACTGIGKTAEGMRSNKISAYFTLPARSIYTRSWLGPSKCHLYQDAESNHDLSPVREDGDSILKNKTEAAKGKVNDEKVGVIYPPARNDFVDEKHIIAGTSDEDILLEGKHAVTNLSALCESKDDEAVIQEFPDTYVLEAKVSAKNSVVDAKQLVTDVIPDEDILVTEIETVQDSSLTRITKTEEDDKVGLTYNSNLINDTDTAKSCLAKVFLMDELEALTDRTTPDVRMEENYSITDMFGNAILDNQTVALTDFPVEDVLLNESDRVVQFSPKDTSVKKLDVVLDSAIEDLHSSDKTNEPDSITFNCFTNERQAVTDLYIRDVQKDHELVEFSAANVLLNEIEKVLHSTVKDIVENEVKSVTSFSGEELFLEEVKDSQSKTTLMNNNDSSSSFSFQDIVIYKKNTEDNAAVKCTLIHKVDQGKSVLDKDIVINDDTEELADSDFSKTCTEMNNAVHILTNEKNSGTSLLAKDFLKSTNNTENNAADKSHLINGAGASTSASTPNILVVEEVPTSTYSAEDILPNKRYTENVPNKHILNNEEDPGVDFLAKDLLKNDNDTSGKCIFMNEVDPSTNFSTRNILVNEEVPASVIKDNNKVENADGKCILMNDVDPSTTVSTRNISLNEEVPDSSSSSEDISLNKTSNESFSADDILMKEKESSTTSSVKVSLTNENASEENAACECTLINDEVQDVCYSAGDKCLDKIYKENFADKYILMFEVDPVVQLSSNYIISLKEKDIVADFTAKYSNVMNYEAPVAGCSTDDNLFINTIDCTATNRKSTVTDLTRIDILRNSEDLLATEDDLTFSTEELACLEEVLSFWSDDDTISTIDEDLTSTVDELLSARDVNKLPKSNTQLTNQLINVVSSEKSTGKENKMDVLNYSNDNNEKLIEVSEYFRDITTFQQNFVGVIAVSDT